jgi:hypothetical protein
MSKMHSHDPFGFLKHKLWLKEGSLKVKNYPNCFALRWRATYNWKALNESYNFALNLTSIEGLHTNVWACKVLKIPK